jgi:sialate O-acetylesterase
MHTRKAFCPVRSRAAILAMIICGCGVGAASGPARGIRMSPVFGDHMVFQRDQSIPVWGKAEPGGTVTVRFAGKEKKTTAGADSSWSVRLGKRRAGGPHVLNVIGRDTLAFKDVLVGEVWLCSGQSNMEMPIAGWGKVLDYEREIRESEDGYLRLFTVKRSMSGVPQGRFQTDGWQPSSPSSAAGFSGTAYFFARELRKKLGIPVGLILSSWGGTPVESWMSGSALKAFPDFAPRILELEAQAPNIDAQRYEFERKSREWRQALDKLDSGYRASPSWDKADVEDQSWKTMSLPVLWEQAGYPAMDGIVWFRKTITIPETWAGKNLRLSLGPIDDTDTTWFNGVKVGTMEVWNLNRNYAVGPELVRPGRNTIAVRVMDTGGGGGLYGAANQLFLASASGDTIPLSGDWRVSVGLDARKAPPAPLSPDQPGRPSVLYNGMIHPLQPYGMRGVIWYQGEANTGRAKQYQTLFPSLILDWRRQWKQGDFPFLFVQLANYMDAKSVPGDDDWAELREAQLMTLRLPHTGMAVAIDIGDAKDIHPKNKQEVGRRLALAAEGTVYKQKVDFSGPVYRSMAVEKNSIRLFFEHARGLAAADRGPLRGFALAGADRKFIWAEARIDGNTIVVTSPTISEPAAVRYGWASNPQCNLVNESGLPASPFRTDAWPGITQ